MKLLFYTITLILILTSCKEPKREFLKIDFKTNYKFSSEIENQVAKDTVPWKYQTSASDYAIKGEYKNALKHWDLVIGGVEKKFTKNQIDSIHEKYEKINAVDYIIKQSTENQLIIINEAHHNSSHRVFTKSLLQKLFDNGYKNLGLEALSYSDSALNQRKYPVQETGYYTKDPQFGNLIRTALEIGYTLFAYKQKGHFNGEKREIKQAKNIHKIIKANPNEKYLIHCGFDHALEGTLNSWGKAMAGRLHQYTGINPLTINQTAYSEKSKSEFNHPILKALNSKEPIVLVDKKGDSYSYKKEESWTDITVFHPSTVYIDNRPGWLFENENENISISLPEIKIDFPVMVLAFKKGEDINTAIPVDIVEIQNKSLSSHIALKKGNYIIVITNKNQSVKFEQEVN